MTTIRKIHWTESDRIDRSYRGMVEAQGIPVTPLDTDETLGLEIYSYISPKTGETLWCGARGSLGSPDAYSLTTLVCDGPITLEALWAALRDERREGDPIA